MKQTFFITLILALSGLTACTDDKASGEVISVTPTAATESAAKTSINEQLSKPLPENAPEVGTAVTAMINVMKPQKNADETDESSEAGDITKIMWEDLIPADFRPDTVMQKYQAEIDSIPEGSLEEQALFEKIMAEFNNAPSNETLAGKQVKIPGFVSPLDTNGGMVSEFLLVPYFGSCIHSPPPPVNQTVLVKPQEGKSISMEDIYVPVWVTGRMKVEMNTTDLAQAGYMIEDAALEIYEAETATTN